MGKGDRKRSRRSVAFNAGALILAALLAVSCTTYHRSAKPAAGVYHRVKQGETFFGIARAYRIDPQYLAKVNKIKNIEMIVTGQVLFIPHAKKALVHNLSPGRKTTGEVSTYGDRDQRSQAGSEEAKLGPAVSFEHPDASSEETDDPKRERASGKTGRKIKITSEDIPPRHGETGETPVIGDEKTEKTGRISLGPLVKPDREKSHLLETKTAGAPDPPPPVKSETEKSAPQSAAGAATSSQLRVEIAPVTRTFVWPVKGKVVSRFGRQKNGMFYNGIDIAGQENLPVVASADGTVIFSAVLKDYGETVIIKHDGDYATVYSYLGKRLVKRDDLIRQNDLIGTLAVSGSAGEPVVHFEIRYKNKARDPLSFLR